MNANVHPARWLLTQLHPDDTLEEVEGDLGKIYGHWHGRVQVTLRYLLRVLKY